MDIARDICTDSFYIVNSGLPCIAVTAVPLNLCVLRNQGMRDSETGVGKGGVYYFGRLSPASPSSSTGVNSRLWSVGGYMGGMGVSRKGSDPPITSATNKGAGRPDGN